MRTVRIGVKLLFLAFLIAILYFLAVGLFPVISDRTRVHLVKRWAPRVLAVLGIKLLLKGKVPDESAAQGLRDSGPGYLVCANHISFADIFVLDTVLPVRFIAKKEIEAWPIFGGITKHIGTIFIDRSKRRALLEVAAEMDKHLGNGENVLFFPEGTTGPGDALLPFYANLFTAATESRAEVLPITIRYLVDGKTSTMPSYANRELWDVLKDILGTKNVAVEVTVLEPIAAEGVDRRVLCAKTSQVMASALGWPDATALKAKKIAERLEEIERNQPQTVSHS